MMLPNMKEFSNVIGIIGVMMVFSAYTFSQFEKWKHDSYIYLFTNLIGSLLIVVSLLYHWNLASFIIEVLWSSISITGLVRIMYKMNKLKLEAT